MCYNKFIIWEYVRQVSKASRLQWRQNMSYREEGDDMVRGFSVNIKGRVKNFTLPKNQPLIPLFEAIVNSLHAIEERKRNDRGFSKGHIVIEVERESQLFIQKIDTLSAIESFVVKDNGVGFNEPNLRSFMESDSTYKADKGGKGVGRFSWLIAFQKTTIDSIYLDNGKFVKRSFEFSIEQAEINDTLEDCKNVTDNLTTIRLTNCLEPYRTNLPKQAHTIAMRVIQHCLVYFMSTDCPQIDLLDEGERYNLNGIFHDAIKTDENQVIITVGEKKFNLLHIKAEETSINGNKLFLCANNRLVETKELEKYITDLDREIYQESGFWYVGVLTGEYLDTNVDMNRLSFNILDGGIADSLFNTLSLDQIMNAVCTEVKFYLSDYLMPITESKNKRIKNYVTNEAPQFRHLLKYMISDVAAIKPNLSDEKLDDELHKIKRRFDKEIKEQNRRLLEDLNKGAFTFESYGTLFRKQVEKVSYANGANLAEYIAHRKVIIDLLEFGIRKKEDGHFQKEQFIHNLLYPMRTTSEEMPYDRHNLWLIDEKLAYCSYICSDVPFDNDPKQERTDVLILDRPVAVSENKNDGSEFDTIILFELKRPMRENYSEEDNPITQLYDYVDKIKSGKAKDKDGRVIRSGDNTKFYLYIVCDVTPKIERFANHDGFYRTPDKLGYYRYNEPYKAYIEILPFDKMINDSKKRNKVLFEKLGI